MTLVILMTGNILPLRPVMNKMAKPYRKSHSIKAVIKLICDLPPLIFCTSVFVFSDRLHCRNPRTSHVLAVLNICGYFPVFYVDVTCRSWL